jgi:CubicO group peptidase (beta-lactamase class C family)
VTTSIAMADVAAGRISLDGPVHRWLPGWRAGVDDRVTVRHLLNHSAGLPAHLPLWRSAATPAYLREAVLDVPLAALPGAASVYSDIGFMLLGFLLEKVGGQSLDDRWRGLWPSSLPWLDFRPDDTRRPTIPPTEIDADSGTWLQGVVHDENARRLGGVAGHAGLFGTASAVGAFAAVVLASFSQTTWLATPASMQVFARRSEVPGSSRALGWDTMLPTSSCGTRLSPTAIGHTGFTGASLWIDWERDLYVVLLSHRIHPTRANDAFVGLRPLVHDAIVADLAGLRPD